MDYASLLDETDLPIENVGAVIVETDDHTAPDLESVGLDGVDLFGHAAVFATKVLQLAGFTQRILVGAFDSHKDGTDICLVHESQEFVVVCEIERSFGKKGHRIVMRLLPGDHLAENLFDRPLVANQIVIDDEGGTHRSGTANRLQFCHDLWNCLQSRP